MKRKSARPSFSRRPSFNKREKTDKGGRIRQRNQRLAFLVLLLLLVVTGAILGFVGVYEPFKEFAGSGASVPLIGFGNVLWKGVKEAVQEQGFLGLFAGGFKAGAVGTSAALILGYLASLFSKPKMKE